jgi:3-oxoacyl-(acyl-carrier-protein) synthase
LIPAQICIAGTGIVCALGSHTDEVIAAIAEGRSGLKPLSRFEVSHIPALPAGQSPGLIDDRDLPATHQLARMAADQAMSGCAVPPDAIVLGVTTGGMATTEDLLKQHCLAPEAYRHHGIGTVAEDLARRFHCKGPVLTVSTACSSGGGAIALALAMLRSGSCQRVLTGGVDSLCRLTYYGFKSLQLIDPHGCRPLDKDRRGMSVAEGAGMLLLEAQTDKTDAIQVLGAGLSCDAHHPAQPHPEGLGALAAMQAALQNAGMGIEGIDYINLHGTGTADNDRSETMAINSLFNHVPPPLSSIKGAIGHCLAASGAIEAAVAACCIERGLIPANTGCRTTDPYLKVTPVDRPARSAIRSVLSNSFGFGGNNAAIIIGRSQHGRLARLPEDPSHRPPLTVMGWSAVTGVGFTDQSIGNLSRGIGCQGRLESKRLCQGLPPGVVRRLKRLSQMALSLLAQTQNQDHGSGPISVFFGTGWGSLSETSDFLQGLFDSDEKFSSPTDFIGSVHNAAAGQIGLMARATGANLTLSGGNYSFEQALFCAQMLNAGDEPVIVVGADETHDKLSLLLDPSVSLDPVRSDGGGALIVKRTHDPVGPRVALKYFTTDFEQFPDPHDMVAYLGGAELIRSKYGLILAGLPAAQKDECRQQLERFKQISGYAGLIIDYRGLTGQFATSAAVATVFAASLVKNNQIPLKTHSASIVHPHAAAVLILGLGSALTAIEVCPA